jgi:hypothetical protein
MNRTRVAAALRDMAHVAEAIADELSPLELSPIGDADVGEALDRLRSIELEGHLARALNPHQRPARG